MLDIVIKNGSVVHSDKTEATDIGIKDGKIVLLGDAKLFPEAKKEIDATHQYVLPGLIDAHVHVNLKLGEFTTRDTFYDASLAALYGGTTTFIDFAIPYLSETPLEAVNRRLAEAKNDTLINYAFHGCVTQTDAQSLDDVKQLVLGGISTIKMFTVYKDIVMLGKGEILEVLKVVQRAGGLAEFHAEGADIIEHYMAHYVKEHKTTPHTMPRVVPLLRRQKQYSVC